MTTPGTIETGSPYILGRIEDGVATITFNRPERRNAVGPEMLHALEVALDAADRDDAVRAVVL
ncbi:MAG: enoyl-CoA hydratase, partial [Deltaproteobacteria bacterium]